MAGFYRHYWDHIEEMASERTPARIADVKQPLYYAAGFPAPTGTDLNAAGINFDDFGCLLNYMDEKITGISDPLFYIGKALTTAALHDEDGSTASLNLLISGANKAWYVAFSPTVSEIPSISARKRRPLQNHRVAKTCRGQ